MNLKRRERRQGKEDPTLSRKLGGKGGRSLERRPKSLLQQRNEDRKGTKKNRKNILKEGGKKGIESYSPKGRGEGSWKGNSKKRGVQSPRKLEVRGKNTGRPWTKHHTLEPRKALIWTDLPRGTGVKKWKSVKL